MAGEELFEGLTGRECGEHRTTGGRAWCFACSAWCYPDEPCNGCELPQLRAEITRLRDLLPLNGLGEYTDVRQLVDNHRAWTRDANAETERLRAELADKTRLLEWESQCVKAKIAECDALQSRITAARHVLGDCSPNDHIGDVGPDILAALLGGVS